MRPIGSTSEGDTEFDRMKQVFYYPAKQVCCSSTFHVGLIILTSGTCLLLAVQEILDEVVRELHKVKDEIIHGKQGSSASASSVLQLVSSPKSGFRFLAAIRHEIGRISTS